MRRGFVGWTAAVEPKCVPIVVDLCIDGRFAKSLRAVRQEMGRYGTSPKAIMYFVLDDEPTDFGDLPHGNADPESKL